MGAGLGNELGAGLELDFYGSWKTWNLLRNIDIDASSADPSTHQITANDKASQLLRVSKVPIDQNHVRSTIGALR
jgi:hypothetical protein